MTNLITRTPFDVFKDMDKYFVGFDDQWSRMTKLHDEFARNVPNYPPYNIYKSDDNKYTIELAVAGFGKQDIELQLEEDHLIIKGSLKDDTQSFLYKGIATRAFTRSFVIDDNVVVNGASLINGMLKVFLERIIPEHKKPRKIEIADADQNVIEVANKEDTKQFLTEEKVKKSKASTNV